MDVRFKNVGDSNARFPRHLDVNVTVRARIENRRYAFIIISDQIGKFGDAWRLNGLENERHAKT